MRRLSYKALELAKQNVVHRIIGKATYPTLSVSKAQSGLRTLRAAKAGKLKYRRLNLRDEDFGF